MKAALLVIVALALGFAGGYYLRDSSSESEIEAAQYRADNARQLLAKFDEPACFEQRRILTEGYKYCAEATDLFLVEIPECREAIAAGLVIAKPPKDPLKP